MNGYDSRNKNEYNNGEWSLDPNSKKGRRNCRSTSTEEETAVSGFVFDEKMSFD
jgi:hypothetical protein